MHQPLGMIYLSIEPTMPAPQSNAPTTRPNPCALKLKRLRFAQTLISLGSQAFMCASNKLIESFNYQNRFVGEVT